MCQYIKKPGLPSGHSLHQPQLNQTLSVLFCLCLGFKLACRRCSLIAGFVFDYWYFDTAEGIAICTVFLLLSFKSVFSVGKIFFLVWYRYHTIHTQEPYHQNSPTVLNTAKIKGTQGRHILKEIKHRISNN